jgi:hypothetical protein
VARVWHDDLGLIGVPNAPIDVPFLDRSIS